MWWFMGWRKEVLYNKGFSSIFLHHEKVRQFSNDLRNDFFKKIYLTSWFVTGGQLKGEYMYFPQILITDQIHKGHTKLNMLTEYSGADWLILLIILILKHQAACKKANSHLCYKGTSQNTYGLQGSLYGLLKKGEQIRMKIVCYLYDLRESCNPNLERKKYPLLWRFYTQLRKEQL